jgi:hypothetical protein
MSNYEYQKYITDKQNLKKTIEEYGVAIIPNVLNEIECQNIIAGIWNFFEHITKYWENPINRLDENSWKNFYELFPMHSMLFQHWNIGQSQVCWDVRQNEKLLDIYSEFWNCNSNELLVSFDGLSFNIPPEITNRGWNKNNCWLHCDQSFANNNFKCIQSWITALDINENDATLSFLEKSHKFHEDFAKEFKITDKSDWYKLNNIEKEFYYNKECYYKKIKCPKGSLVLWDSRTIHCGSEALRGRDKPNFRAIIYICYMPRNLSTKKDLEKKQKAFQELRMTTHWPCKIKLFPKNPRTYGKKISEINKIDPPVLKEIGYKLAGF